MSTITSTTSLEVPTSDDAHPPVAPAKHDRTHVLYIAVIVAVGIVVPTGYSFNLDGTAIYLTMASLFIANSLGNPLSVSEQVSLLVFMVMASKGAAGVSGAGLATLAGGLAAHEPALLDGVGLIVGIDRFMSEARAVTNFIGNTVGTLVVGTWAHQVDRDQVERVLSGRAPFDERTMDPSVSPVDLRAKQDVPTA